MKILWKGRMKNCIMLLAAALFCSAAPVQAEEQTENSDVEDADDQLAVIAGCFSGIGRIYGDK